VPRQRIYADDAARQRAHRRRTAAKRNVTNRDGLGDFLEKLSFIRDLAGSVAKDSIRNWRGWQNSSELHCHALQMDLDDLVSRLDALLHGDNEAFSGSEWQAWRQERQRQLASH
jgi:hypothetical protein